MNAHVVELLPDFMNGALDRATAASVADHLDTCPDCNQVLASYQEVLGALALTLKPVRPDPSVRARVLASASTGRLHRFAGHVSALFHVDDAAARAALDAIDEATGWESGPFPGVLQRLVEGAPPGHLMGFIRIPPGVRVPWHEHLGSERTLVLQGRLLDNDGNVYVPGEEMPKSVGTTHTFVSDGRSDLVCGVIIEGGYKLLD